MRLSYPKNVKSKYHVGFDGLIFQAAKASSINDFNEAMAKMKSLHCAAWKYIEGTKPEKWARTLFPVRRFGHVTSNMAECINKWFGDSRYLDPVAFFRAYTLKLNCMFEKRRAMYAPLEDDDVPKRVGSMIKTAKDEGDTLKVVHHTRDICEVQRKSVCKCDAGC